ncbi:MAG TPA: RidA family protein, partial [Planctomycetota bacterium]|nr:RidA family protein [Planctomycetota bacterium]
MTPSITHQFVNVVATSEGGFDAVLDDAAGFVREAGTRIIAQDTLGSCEAYESGMHAIRHAFGGPSWPVTWIAGSGRQGQIISGTQLHAVASDNLAPVFLDGAVAGYVFGDADARQCILGNVGPRSVTESREAQARQVFERIEQALAAAGMTFSNVVRTWMYISRIPEWYGQFNDVRTQFFRER